MSHRNPVVVGLGDHGEQTAALDWAAREAAARDTRLEILRCYHLTTAALPWDSMIDVQIMAELRAAAHTTLHAAVQLVRRSHPDLDVTADAVEGRAADVLVARSGAAALTVVGSRQLSTVGAVVLGSVSTVVAASAHGPVVVVEGPPGLRGEDPPVVVGVDGSAAAEGALAFGLEHADRAGRSLRAVFCWRPSALVPGLAPEAHDRAARWLAEALAGWQAKYPAVRVRRSVLHAHAVDGLAAESLGAELLVVGAKGRHARVGSLLGSVSQGVLHAARCPVAVVHAGATSAL